MNEQFGVRSAAGVGYMFPPTAHPNGDWGESYDLSANRAAHRERYWLEGTGQTIPKPVSLTMEVETESEQATESLLSQIVAAARQASVITRTGQPDRPVLGLQAWASSVVDTGDSAVRLLTLTWWPAAPGQTSGYTPAPAPATPTLVLYLGGVGSAPITVNRQDGTRVWSGTIVNGQSINSLTIGQTYTIIPGPVDGFTTPPQQVVTMQDRLTVTLTYASAGSTTPPVTSPDPGVY